MQKKALVVGISGITGSNLAERLLAEGWIVYGLARNPGTELPRLMYSDRSSGIAGLSIPPGNHQSL